jgi:hypothetical protein
VALESIPASLKRQIKKIDHHIYSKGYIGSLVREDVGEIWEFYDQMSKTEGTVLTKHCRLCGMPISKEEYEEFLGYHANCFYIEEIQDADDL